MTCQPSHIIKSSPLRERMRFRDGDTRDIIEVIMDMDAVANQYVNTEAVQCLRGSSDYETLRNVWAFVKKNVRYKADAPGREIVKSPAGLFTAGKGDCKSLSIAEVALLRALGFSNIRYRFTAYSNQRDVTHVYVVVRHKGRDVILDAVHQSFDREDPYTYKMEKKASTVAISGISGLNNTNYPFYYMAPVTRSIAAILVLWGGFKILT